MLGFVYSIFGFVVLMGVIIMGQDPVMMDSIMSSMPHQ